MASVVAACFSSGLINPVSTPGATTALTISSFSDWCLLLVGAAGRISSEVVVDADQELVEQGAQQPAQVRQQPGHPPAQDRQHGIAGRAPHHQPPAAVKGPDQPASWLSSRGLKSRAGLMAAPAVSPKLYITQTTP